MTFKLFFHEKALKEFRALDAAVRDRLKRKLAERLENPRVNADRLSGERDRYKIKLKTPGLRLVYEVVDDDLIVFVLAVDKRERSTVYEKASGRFYQRK
ncbi:type II toxin-antitoxin system RelE/ParE family toxin [Paenirhodobacter sp. CAU 1674]|uniref:type II toxin-antitoxin system RelE family toxin n=1 Tax=Paenirhodobacter sp. CAU 1674 TaxID=3032596 RepID=UPI0023DB1E27|nr:type II toxin-antitoxin system RelE/ParE family toxin [Paenirhodobacter sp. CAU 1674]MDF2140806.1 type II toxin-antitoxin system RelE/ParE family toxin [Paenirhodobacter sp. CAU 1674]